MSLQSTVIIVFPCCKGLCRRLLTTVVLVKDVEMKHWCCLWWCCSFQLVKDAKHQIQGVLHYLEGRRIDQHQVQKAMLAREVLFP